MLKRAITFLRTKSVREQLYDACFYEWQSKAEILKQFSRAPSKKELENELSSLQHKVKEKTEGKSIITSKEKRRLEAVGFYLSIVEKDKKDLTKKERRAKRKFQESNGLGPYYGRAVPGAYSRELRRLICEGYIEEHPKKKELYRSTIKPLWDYLDSFPAERDFTKYSLTLGQLAKQTHVEDKQLAWVREQYLSIKPIEKLLDDKEIRKRVLEPGAEGIMRLVLNLEPKDEDVEFYDKYAKLNNKYPRVVYFWHMLLTKPRPSKSSPVSSRARPPSSS